MTKNDFRVLASVASGAASAYWVVRPSDYLSRPRAILAVAYSAANIGLLVRER